MSVSVTKDKGATMLALTFDPESKCPPLCQIFKSLCCSSSFCSVSEHLRASQSILAALHIMVGLLNISLGLVLMMSGEMSPFSMGDTAFPIWLGALFIVFGITSILSEKFPSPCLVGLNAIWNLLGIGFAIAGVVLYSINMVLIDVSWMCELEHYGYFGVKQPPKPDSFEDRCRWGQDLTNVILVGMNSVLIVLSVLELCVSLSSAVLSIKALKRENMQKDPELQKPLMDGTCNI